jgi:threonyl-tRNA synthetase
MREKLGDEKSIYFHSSAHILAQAVKELFPEAKLGIGPAIEEGFYYDFDKETPFSADDLLQLENKMKEIIKRNLPFEKKFLPKQEAIKLFEKLNEPYKIELIKEIEDGEVSIYQQGDFIDLCRGPHLSSTGEVKEIKLLSTAGAYWRGDEKNKMLQRIYGVAFQTKKELKSYLEKIEEIKKRDHRKIGQDLDLFSLVPEKIGSGLVLWHPKLALVRNIIEQFWKEEHFKRGYQLVYTPHLAKAELWKKSGHLEFFKQNMFSSLRVEDQDYIIKPMNCPFHILIYQSKTRSFRELPLRYAELGTVYRYEKSGVLHGMLRVRGFTQDDAHIFCQPTQLEDELVEVLELAQYILKIFGYQEYKIYLSTRPERYIGSVEIWEMATKAIKSALQKHTIPYQLDPGEGVFYGPKIDIKMTDAVGREWQGPTIQVDFNLPQKFKVEYIDSDNSAKPVVMIHRTVMGAMERFIGGLIEHYKGGFPPWLAPTQVIILPITDQQISYGQQIATILRKNDLRVELDTHPEKLGFKIRQAQLQKIPYMLIIGPKEVENGTLSVRLRTEENLGSMPIEKFVELVKRVIDKKSLGLIF